MARKTRRSLLAAAMAAGAAAGMSAAPPTGRADAATRRQRGRFRFGVQLYPLAAAFSADIDALFAGLARAGFRGVEFAGFGRYRAAEIRAALSRAGLAAVGAHCLPLTLSDDAARRQLAFCAETGIGCALTALPAVRPTPADPQPSPSAAFNGLSLDDLRWSAARMTRFADLARATGIDYAYHTHNLDFALVGGVTVLDRLMQLTPPRSVGLQLDVGNAVAGGGDPLALLRSYRRRIRSVHVKDWQPGFTPRQDLHFPVAAPLGSGVIDWPSLLSALAGDGIAQIIVEQEGSGAAALTAQIQALDYLRRLTAAP